MTNMLFQVKYYLGSSNRIYKSEVCHSIGLLHNSLYNSYPKLFYTSLIIQINFKFE